MAGPQSGRIEQQRWELLFTVRKSVRYHDYRRKFYLTCQAWVNFLGVVLGSLAFAQIAEGTFFERLFPAIFVLSSSFALVGGISEKAAVHHDLYKRFIRLERHFNECLGHSEETISSLEHQMLEIETEEPSIYSALNRQCHNEVLRSEGQYDELQPLRWYHRALKNLWNFDNLPLRPLPSSGPAREA